MCTMKLGSDGYNLDILRNHETNTFLRENIRGEAC